MEVTKANFESSFELFRTTLQNKNAVAVAFDFEMSGLHKIKSKETCVDDPQFRYEKACMGASDFGVLQLGICVAIKTEENKFDLAPFNIYCFPEDRKGILNQTFVVQASALEFLSKHNFDFNKCFKEGVPFLRCDQEETLRQKGVFTVPRKKKVEKQGWLDSRIKNIVNEQIALVTAFVKSNETQLTLEPCNNSFVRLNVHKAIDSKFPDLRTTKVVQENEDGRNDTSIVVHKLNDDEKAAFDKKEEDEMEQEAQKAIGVRQFIDALKGVNIPVIAHNSLLDFCHLYHSFVDEFPKTYIEFCDALHSLFPQVYDTKLLGFIPSIREKAPANNLSNFVTALTAEGVFDNPPEFSVGDSFKDYNETGKEHEAGYDALLTVKAYLLSKAIANSDVIDSVNKLQLFKYPHAFFLENPLEQREVELKKCFVLNFEESCESKDVEEVGFTSIYGKEAYDSELVRREQVKKARIEEKKAREAAKQPAKRARTNNKEGLRMEWTVFWIDDKTLLIRATTTAFAQTLRIGFDQSPLFMVKSLDEYKNSESSA
eukprot:TRINITY_DN16904_c0_g1_i1.p1 TRINITY_DN16904_c0_g1~~TRINITY_DN16904_c0_g1_i1.p1  ORF type:complete len:543 (+),score=132.44 TRINITY_DN16904_c0_g1_i1:44-1672(+)